MRKASSLSLSLMWAVGISAILASCNTAPTAPSPVITPSGPERPTVNPPQQSVLDYAALMRNLPDGYVVTIVADPACNLPDVARYRRYTATISPDEWEESFIGRFTDAKVRSSKLYDFGLRFEFDGSSASVFISNPYVGGFILENVGGGLLMLSGKAEAIRVGQAISGPLSGTFGYCDRPAAGGDTLETACQVKPTTCSSERHFISVERRSP